MNLPGKIDVYEFNFFIDKLFQGFLWDFVRIIAVSEYPDMNFRKLKSDMGNHFSEHHLFYQV